MKSLASIIFLRESLKENPEPSFVVVFFDASTQNPVEGLKQKIKSEVKYLFEDKFKFVNSNLELEENLEQWVQNLGNKKLLIIIDQFNNYSSSSSQNKEVKTEFLTELTKAINYVTKQRLPVNFLFSLQADSQDPAIYFRKHLSINKNIFVSWLKLSSKEANFFEIASYKEDGSLYTPPNDSIYTFEKGFVDNLIGNLADKPTGSISNNPNGIETSALQRRMTYLWEEIPKQKTLSFSIDLVKKLTESKEGKLAANLTEKEKIDKQWEIIDKSFLNDKRNNLNSQQRKIASFIFYHLVTPSGESFPTLEEDFLKTAKDELPIKDLNVSDQDIEDLLKELTDKRILQCIKHQDKDKDKPRYVIRHHGLSKAIIDWRDQYLQLARDIAIEKGLPAQSLLQLRRGQHDLAALLALEAYEFNKQDNLDMLDEVDEALAQSLSVDYFSQIFQVHTDSVSTVAFSPDSNILASASHDYSIARYHLSSNNSESNGNRIKYAHKGKILAIAFAPDPEKNSKILVSGSQDGTVKLWNLDDKSFPNISRKKILCRYTYTNKEKEDSSSHITSLAFSRDCSMLAIGSDRGTIILFKLKSRKSLLTLDDKDDKKLQEVYPIQSGTISLNPSWKRICEPPIYILQNQGEKEGRKVCSLAFPPKGIECKEGNWLAAGYNNGTVRLWDLNQTASKLACNIQEIKSYESLRPRIKYKNKNTTTVALNQPVKGLAFNQDGNILAFGGEDREIWLCYVDKLLDKSKSQRLYKRLGENEDLGKINSLAFHPNKDNILASAGEDQKVRLWDVSQQAEKPEKPEKLPGQYFGISSVAFSSDGKWLATGNWNHRVRLWDLELPPQAKPLILNNTQINESDKTKLQESSILKESLYATHKGNVMFVAVSPNGKMIASASWDRTVGLSKIVIHSIVIVTGLFQLLLVKIQMEI